jgi:predicted permease
MQPANVLTASISLGRHSYPEGAQRLAFFNELESRLTRMPGVTHIAISDSLPPGETLRGSLMYGTIDVEGRPGSGDATGGRAVMRSVTPGYFAALGIPILRGRAFQESDRDPNANAVILSARMARRMFPGEDPTGKRIRPARSGPWLAVVGVAGNVKNNGLAGGDDPECYVARGRSAAPPLDAAVIVRSPADPQAVARWLRAEIAAIDPALPVSIKRLEQHIGEFALRPRFNAVLVGIFAGMGLLLAAVGVYGVISYMVGRRTAEIGMRMAMGSTPGAVGLLVLLEAARWIAAGAVLGVLGSLLTNRLLRGMLFQMSPNDPRVLAVALGFLLGAAFLASWVPALRAARLDPVKALRQE